VTDTPPIRRLKRGSGAERPIYRAMTSLKTLDVI